MDELLRAYAKKRQAQAEPLAPMHPATRKLLQAEIKRTLASAKPAAPQSWRVWRWPLMAMWGGMAVLLVMFAALNAQFRRLEPAGKAKVEGRIKKDEKAGALTRNASASKEESFAKKALEPEERMGGAIVMSAPAGGAPPAPTAAEQSPTTPPSPVASASSRKFTYRRPAQAAAAPSAASESLDVPAGNFVQVRDRARKAAALPPSNLLSNFRMSRSGQMVSVVDADGSVYKGRVLADGISPPTEGFGRAAAAQASLPKDAAAGTNWTFNVTGLNHSLQQNISFTGNVLDMPRVEPVKNATAQNRRASQFQNASNASQNSRITGKVQIGGGQPYEIEAKPPAPE